MNKASTCQVEGALPHRACVAERTYKIKELMDQQQSTLHLLKIKDFISMQFCSASSSFDIMTKISYINLLNDNGFPLLAP